jgi:hypothetical protein
LRTTVARVVASRALTLIVATPGTLRVTQTRSRSPPQEVDTLVVGTTEVLVSVGAMVTAPEALRLAILEAPAPAPTEALITPPLVGKTPALAVTVAKLPRPRVMQALTAASEHDVERDVIVLPLITVGTARTAGTVTAADATGADTVAPAVMRPPLDGRTPASRVTVAKSPRPKVMQASTAAPVHDVETAVIVFPEIVRGVARTAGTVRAAEATGRDALRPALTRPPLVGRALAPRVTVPRGPRPRLTQTLRRPLPVHDCWIAVIVSEPTAVLVGTTVTLVMDGTPSETMLPSVLRAPRVTVVEGPTPSARQSTLSHEAVVVVITAPPGRVVGTLEAVMAGVTPAPILMMLPSEFKAPRVTVAEGPTPRARQTRPLHEAVVLVTPEMLGRPVTVGVAPAPRPRSRMLPSAGLRTPRVAVAEGPRPIAKQTSPLHLVDVAVKAPLGAEKVVGVAPALPPTPRLTVMPFPIPRVAHKSTNAPPQLVVVEVKEAPGGKVIPVGLEIALVMDATTLDCCERMEEMEAVASL